jgi:hypothetical protein
LAASTGPIPNSSTQSHLGLGHRGFEARLHLSDPLLQLADVDDQVSGQVPAGDRRNTGRSNLIEQRGGALGGEVSPGSAGDQVDQQRVQAVDGLGAGGDQVLARLGQQVQHHRLVLDPHLSQLRGALGGDRHRDRVGSIALAAVADRQHPHPGGQLGRHIQD